MGLGDVAYTGLATYGRVKAVMGFVVSLLVGGAFLACGLWVALSKEVRTSSATGTVREASCNATRNPPQCHVTVAFTDANGNPVTAATSTSDKMYVVGEQCMVRYDPINPYDAQIGKSAKWMGWVFAGVGLLVMLIGGASLYVSMQYKAVAAIGGGVGLVDELMN